MEPEGSLQYSQELATGPYPGTDKSSPTNYHPTSLRWININLPSTTTSSELISSVQVSRPKLCTHFSLPWLLH